MKEYIKKNMKTIIVLLIIIVLGAIGTTLAVSIGTLNVSLVTGNYNVVYSGTTTLPTVPLEPIYDADLLSSSNASKIMKIDFTVKGAQTNPTDRPIIYDVSLTNLNIPQELKSHLLKWRLYKNGSLLSSGSFSSDFDAQVGNRMVLTETQQDLPSYSSTADSYTFYVWISEECTGAITSCTTEMNTAPLMGKTFSGEIRVELSTKDKKELVRYKGAAVNTLFALGFENDIKEGTPDFSKIAPTIATYKESTGSSSTYSLNTTISQYYVTYSSTIDFNETTGKYSLVSPSVAKYSSIYGSLVGKYIVSYSPSSSSSLASYTNSSIIYEVTSASYDTSAKTGVIGYTSLTSAVDTYDLSDTGIFAAEDDLGTSYYFRGDVTNNYVYFAGFYWRIIRINGDGTIRMIYDGTSAHANGESSTDRSVTTEEEIVFNSGDEYDEHVNANAGYMYGNLNGTTYAATHANTNNSIIKTYLEDTWYANNIKETTYEQYIADAIYCNDRSISTENSGYAGIGYTTTEYAAQRRMSFNAPPTLKCKQENDRFTVGDSIGNVSTNGDLKYPVGLLTVDEANFSGGVGFFEKNERYYLYTGEDYWTMSPLYYNYYLLTIGIVSYNGSLELDAGVSSVGTAVRPVISLKSDAIKSGTGTMTDPFTVSS